MLCAAILATGVCARSQMATKSEKPSQSALPIAVSGREERLAAAILERVKTLAPKTENLGNVYPTFGNGAPHKLIAVAMDEPGYVVSGITPDGYLRVQRLPQAAVTPIFDVLNFAQPVWVFTRSGKQVNGVFAGLSVHLQPGRVGGPKMNHADELFVDVGAKNAAEARAAGVDVLDAVATQRHLLRLGTENLSGQSAGDRTALLAVLAMLKQPRSAQTKGTLTVAFVAQRWTGGRGMNRLLTELRPDELVFVGHVAASNPLSDKEKVTAETPAPGNGILIGAPNSVPEKASEFIDELKSVADAGKLHATVVPAAMPRIVSYVPGAEYPQRSAEIGVPVRWAETPAETVNLRDVRDLQQFLSAYAGTSEPEIIEPESTPNQIFPGTIESLTTAYGASGHESTVREKVKELLPEWARKLTQTDAAGNLFLHLEGETDGK